MKYLIIAFLCALVWSPPAEAGGDVIADLSSTSIAVSTGFTGTTLTVFGVLNGRDDVVVAIEGPDAPITVRRKSKHYGIWLADTSASFEHVPKFFALANTSSHGPGPSEQELASQGLSLRPVLANGSIDDSGEFHDALIRIQEARGLYNFDASHIIVRSGRLFRADFDLPVNVPIGTYRVHIVALQGGAVVGARALPLTIDESGVAALVQNASVDHPFIYAFLTLMAVLVIGAASTSLSVVRKGS